MLTLSARADLFRLDRLADAFEAGQFLGKNFRLAAKFRHQGAEHHGATQRRQHVIGFHHQGRRRILLEPLQPGEKFRQDLLLFSQAGAQDDFLLAERQDAFLGGGDCRLLGLDGLGNGDETLGDLFLLADGGGDIAFDFFNIGGR